MPKSERLELRLDAELLARVDAARGREPRASWVRWALEKALDGLGDGLPRAAVTDGPVASAAPVVRPAPSRASSAPPVRFKTPRPKGGS